MYILRPHYGDMSIEKLGSSLGTIKKAFMEHWCYDPDEIDNMEDYIEEFGEEGIQNMNKLLSLKTIDEVVDFYNENFDEDFHVEEI